METPEIITRGRPKLPPGVSRNHTIGVRVNAEDYTNLKGIAGAQSLSLSGLFRLSLVRFISSLSGQKVG